MQFAELNFLARYFRNFGRDFMAAAIEYHRSRAWPETKNIARVMRFCSVQYECIGIPFFRRDVEAVHFRLDSGKVEGSVA